MPKEFLLLDVLLCLLKLFYVLTDVPLSSSLCRLLYSAPCIHVFPTIICKRGMKCFIGIEREGQLGWKFLPRVTVLLSVEASLQSHALFWLAPR